MTTSLSLPKYNMEKNNDDGMFSLDILFKDAQRTHILPSDSVADTAKMLTDFLLYTLQEV